VRRRSLVGLLRLLAGVGGGKSSATGGDARLNWRVTKR
jgi:hypothetical protein